MPNIEGYKLTNKGNQLQIKVEAGKCKLDITSLKLGSGTATGDIVNLTDLVQVEQTVPVSKVAVVDDYTCRITGLVSNQGLNKTYYVREIGLYAEDPDEGEILYMIGIDKNPDVMPADNYQMVITLEFNIDVLVSNVNNITVSSQPVHLITDEDLQNAIDAHNDAADCHENMLKKVLVTAAKSATDTDWNNLTESCTYKVDNANEFTAEKHQPVGAFKQGELVVIKNGDEIINQIYYANSIDFDKAGSYHRIKYANHWTEWVRDITNKGGIIDGDFTINGSLSVPNLYVKDKLLIGDYDPSNPDTSNFLTKEDLQKIQDQIIAPSQNIYIDNTNGKDSNDGSRSNPLKTIERITNVLKSGVPKVNIYLCCENENKVYECTCLELQGKDVSFTAYANTISWEEIVNIDANRPIISVEYGKLYSRSVNSESYYWWGNILVRCDNLLLQGVNINLKDAYIADTATKCLIFANTLLFYATKIEIGNYDLLANYTTECTVRCGMYNNPTIFSSTGFLVNSSQNYRYFINDPKTTTASDITSNNESIETLAVQTNNKDVVVISLLFDSKFTASDEIFAHGNKGCADKVAIIYANY